jgi:dienelactone hydrolase
MDNMGPATTAEAPESTGPFTPIIESDPSLADFTIYRPKDLSAGGLPVVVWGNGGCAALGGMYRGFLSEIASRGYLVISLGKFGPEDVRTWRPPAPPPRPDGQSGPPPSFKPATTWHQMIEAIDWAVEQNAESQSRFAGKLDVGKIAVVGHSCGGLQAQRASLDPRVTTALLLNSGAFKPGASPMSDMGFTADDVVKLRAPIVYIEGGPKDMAYAQGRHNYENTLVPTMFIDLDVGHGGTYAQPHGGEYAEVSAAWLDWHLKGDASAKEVFMSDENGLKADPKWTVERKNWN